ncbi:hypothetical protein [Cognatishimia sp. F0-27]|uniref:hypothetical protein n=1 Tax=Cognatishimia sp. F0-27 TaxID=2816855 RepID=UPI001D0C1C98|nr:hypothetical protein [Cognatishimia sp. F0-27]MCC1494658.1 hypothetical protein [Cognatishimia sp. F0-27]
MLPILALGPLVGIGLLAYAFGLFEGPDEDDDEDQDIPEFFGRETNDSGDDGDDDSDDAGDDDDDADDGGDDTVDGGDDDADDGGDDDADDGGDDTTGGSDTIETVDGAIVSGTGTSGDDVLIVGTGETATGGAGADTFFIVDEEDGDFTPANGATITDFESGTDRIVLSSFPDTEPGTPERLDVYDWDVRADGVALTRQPEGADPIDLVFLEGVTAPPPEEDIGQRIIIGEDPSPALDIDGLSDVFPAVGTNFVLRFDGTAGDDTVDYDSGTTTGFSNDFSRFAEVDTGDGADEVDFAGARIDADLGAGADTYNGRTSILAGEVDPIENIDGGDGSDTISVGESVIDIIAGSGDDSIDAGGVVSGRIDGGPGEDAIIVGKSADAVAAGVTDPLTVFGGAGPDAITVEIDRDVTTNYDPPILADFDQAEDRLVIFLDAGYTGAGEVTLEQRPGGGGTGVLLDGTVIVEVATSLTDTAAIAVATV